MLPFDALDGQVDVDLLHEAETKADVRCDAGESGPALAEGVDGVEHEIGGGEVPVVHAVEGAAIHRFDLVAAVEPLDLQSPGGRDLLAEGRSGQQAAVVRALGRCARSDDVAAAEDGQAAVDIDIQILLRLCGVSGGASGEQECDGGSAVGGLVAETELHGGVGLSVGTGMMHDNLSMRCVNTEPFTR